MLQRPDRGSFATAWVFPGGKLDASDGDASTPEAELAAAIVAGVRETAEETGLVLNPATLIPTAVWTPPIGAPVRVRTWFFTAILSDADRARALTLSADEVVHAEWARPVDILERHARGELMLYPPTWVTLHSLTSAAGEQSTPSAVADYRTRVRKHDGGLLFLWQGDDEYDGPHDADGVDHERQAARHRLDTRVLPWVYERS